MTAQAVARSKLGGRKSRSFLLALAIAAAMMAAVATFVSYMLWPTWPKAHVALDAPGHPGDRSPVCCSTCRRRRSGRRCNVSRARTSGWTWCFFGPRLRRRPDGTPKPPSDAPIAEGGDARAVLRGRDDRLFVTIAGRGAVLAPARAAAHHLSALFRGTGDRRGPDGLAILPFRAGTPYEGEDFVYVAEAGPSSSSPFARARPGGLPGTCIQEHALGAAVISCGFHANGCRTGAMASPGSTG